MPLSLLLLEIPDQSLLLRAHLAMYGTIFGCHNFGNWRAMGIWWVEARNAAKCPAMRRTVPTTKNSPAQNVNNAEGKEPCFV